MLLKNRILKKVKCYGSIAANNVASLVSGIAELGRTLLYSFI